MLNFVHNVGIHPTPRASVGYGSGGGRFGRLRGNTEYQH